ncbi:MAG: LuxR C-terminal-related transcriptional regulator, partial [Bacillota bacterium]|nr:LuxR C-terminal-related transcriptional regulator [Bacillota bacterium]
LNDAEETCRDALALAEAHDGRIPPAGLAWAIRGDIQRERNQLVQAEQFIQTGIELAREGGLTDDLQQAQLYLARLKLAQGDPVSARQAMKQALLILKAYRIPRLTGLALMLEAMMALKLGNLPAASSWAHAVGTDVQTDNREYMQEREKLILARVWFAEDRLPESQQLLETVSSAARAAERNGTLIEALVLLALISWQQGEADKSTAVMAELIEKAEPHGYVRLFLDEGEPMRQIMAACLRQAQLAPFRAYGEQVLAAFGPAAAPDTAEVLSPQEIRILSLMAEGASNKDIAGDLFITVGTTKWHVHNIYEKLEVNNRTQAVNRGRELGIIG